MPGYQAVANSEDWDEWLRWKSRLVTATDISRLMTGGPGTWATLKAEKAGLTRGFGGSAYTEWGKAREPVIAKYAKDAWGLDHNTDLFVRDGTMHGATPDFVQPGNVLVGDGKTSEGEEWDESPRGYTIQVNWQMYIRGAQEGMLFVEFHKGFRPTHLEPVVYSVPRDDELIEQMIDVADRFLGLAPPPEIDVYLAARIAAMKREKDARADRDAIDARLFEFIGDRDSFKHVSDIGSISYSKPKPRATFQSEKFRESHPDLAEQFTLPGRAPKPSLRVTPAKEKE